MPVAQLTAPGTPDVKKTEDGEDSLDAVIKQVNEIEPVLYFPRLGESSAHWSQFLQALEHPEPIWPLFSFVTKIQLRKCEKCSREFCSIINYRRHMRIYHRLKKLDKDSKKNRDLLGEYWDKLSVEEAREVVSFDDVLLEEIPGFLILKGVANLRRQPFSSLPPFYMRAGGALLDIVQSKPSCFPISSQELFSILDYASEETFLCGTAGSVQRFMFDGEAGKIVIEPRNLIACASFLLEQKLVKAWLAYKDAEALRWQKLLVDEEEAAQKRKAEILERKRKKKLRQKEQKARERLEDDMKVEGNISSTGEDMSPAEASLAAVDFEAHNPDIPADHDSSSHVTYQCPDTIEGVDGETQSGYDCDTDQIIEQQTSQGHDRLLPKTARQQELPKSQLPVANGLYAKQNSQMSKLGAIQKSGTNCDQNAVPIVNGGKVLSLKPEPETNQVVSEARLHKEPDDGKNHEVLIGSVSVTLGNCTQSEGNLVASRGVCLVENLAKQNTAQEKPIELDSFRGGGGSLTPASQHESKGPLPLQSGGTEAEAVYGKDDKILSLQNSLRLCKIDGSDNDFKSNISNTGAKVNGERLRFSSHAARAFLAQRWKEAISSDHVKLVLSPDKESQQNQDCEEAACQSSNVDRHGIPANTVKSLSATSGAAKSKSSMKMAKDIKTKYIRKQKPAAK